MTRPSDQTHRLDLRTISRQHSCTKNRPRELTDADRRNNTASNRVPYLTEQVIANLKT